MRLLAFPLFALHLVIAVGCAPTHTAGTQGIAPEKLAILHITKTYDVPMLQLTAIQFDDGDKYKIDGDREFYLTPGVHRVAIDLTAKVEGPFSWIPMGEPKIDGPPGLKTGDLKPGKTYELRGLAGSVQGMISGDDAAITREMATK